MNSQRWLPTNQNCLPGASAAQCVAKTNSAHLIITRCTKDHVDESLELDVALVPPRKNTAKGTTVYGHSNKKSGTYGARSNFNRGGGLMSSFCVDGHSSTCWFFCIAKARAQTNVTHHGFRQMTYWRQYALIVSLHGIRSKSPIERPFAGSGCFPMLV